MPVLSRATVLTVPSCSSAAPPLIKAPRFVAAASADVEITRAQGQPINNSVKPR